MKTELEVLIQHGENACGVDWNKARKEYAALVAVAEAAADFQRTINIQSEGDLNSRDFLEYVTSPAVSRPLTEALAALAAARNQ